MGEPVPVVYVVDDDVDLLRAIGRLLESVGLRAATFPSAHQFIEKYDLVDDPFFLDSLLDHPKDRIVDKALARLELLAEDGRLVREKAPRSLQQRLKTQEMTSLDSEVQARAKALRQKLF